MPIRIAAPDLDCDTAHRLVVDVENLLNAPTKSWGFEVSVELVRFPSTSNAAGKRVGGPSCAVREVSPNTHSTALDVELRPGTAFNLDVSSSASPAMASYLSSQAQSLAPFLAEALRRVLADEQAAVAYRFYRQGRSDPTLQDYVDGLSGEVQASIQDDAARAFKSSPEYHLTFSLFAAEGSPSSWDIGTVLKEHIQPLLHVLTSSTNFSVATQVHLYSTFSPSIQPYQQDGHDGWFLRKNDLTAFVNTAEWPLSPSIGSGPTINFVLYVPAKAQMPLRIEDNHEDSLLGGSWLVPQWGGITILNAPIVANVDFSRDEVTSHLSADVLKPAFEVFQAQMLSLLGVPTSSSISLPLRLKAFQRLSALSLHLRTSSNLGSLARLAQHLSSIPIPTHVSELVSLAMTSLKTYRQGSNYGQASTAASEGYKASEKAFFDKSMVGQVYFPDEHKVAVYLPLLGPIGVPLVVGLLREVQMFVARLKSR